MGMIYKRGEIFGADAIPRGIQSRNRRTLPKSPMPSGYCGIVKGAWKWAPPSCRGAKDDG